MIILDTNVVSGLMRASSDPILVSWLDSQPRNSVWITTITVLEIQFGLDLMPDGRRAAGLRTAFDRLVAEMLQRRIAPFDAAAAGETATLMAARQRRGQPQELRDSMIAGTAIARRATLATRNVRHFPDLVVPPVNPWDE
ncbi:MULTISPECIES: type II toxin-antitoxin system VapC family toxin [Methylorubrum]|uniref:type II toxin-antitoxin system VapC family toxin n=1 Tax=Methylorubrum TaxID=2282523 RepID=UPI001478056D|nr:MULTISPECIES: type II toxin-antitoxin system VapC family toxin [Methylorubrum]MCJ2032128.1 type II toxin-antitoxin system VapC family toxin [Methylobacterium sp. J-043]MDF9861074.1 putative nucleic acid-binding protein [Methylorubrum pseudosasae]MDH6640093.1 putative nucleic acid-binding protein [Methylobacterium sp. SuP10 SLI 274]MCP1551583.1 putative nucleic acid-binding protein [Methylorubrum zatmanii]MCP1556520.1 putative nucleic acid-binding protein [Methylorubrum extorquens]